MSEVEIRAAKFLVRHNAYLKNKSVAWTRTACPASLRVVERDRGVGLFTLREGIEVASIGPKGPETLRAGALPRGELLAAWLQESEHHKCRVYEWTPDEAKTQFIVDTREEAENAALLHIGFRLIARCRRWQFVADSVVVSDALFRITDALQEIVGPKVPEYVVVSRSNGIHWIRGWTSEDPFLPYEIGVRLFGVHAPVLVHLTGPFASERRIDRRLGKEAAKLWTLVRDVIETSEQEGEAGWMNSI